MKAFINCELVMHTHFIPEAYLIEENGYITEYGLMKDKTFPENCEIIDLEGKYLAPGLIDIHVHAGDKVRFRHDPAFAAKAHIKHGTTTILPTLGYGMAPDQYINSMKAIRELMKDEYTNIGGIYMEGPYLNPGFGAGKNSIPIQGPARKEVYEEFVREGIDLVRVWAIAPERENVEEYVKFIYSLNPNAKFACAHSAATPQQVEKFMKYGLCIGTHHTNATGTIINYSECRGVCVDECVNYNRDIYAELICDSHGIHVDPYMLRLVRRIKGDDRIILITDQSVRFGAIPKGYEGVTDLWFDDEGEISGSKLTLNVACRNMIKHTGASLVDVFNFASYNPAKAVGFTDRGEIEVGKRADLVVCDHKVNVSGVYIKGQKQSME